MCRNSLGKRSVPRERKRASVVLIFKKDNVENALNHRPILLTRNAYKLLENIIKKTMDKHLKEETTQVRRNIGSEASLVSQSSGSL